MILSNEAEPALGSFLSVSSAASDERKDILFRIPELRAELTAFFEFALEIMSFRPAAAEDRTFITTISLFEEQKVRVIKSKVSSIYRGWSMVKTFDGRFMALGKTSRIPED